MYIYETLVIQFSCLKKYYIHISLSKNTKLGRKVIMLVQNSLEVLARNTGTCVNHIPGRLFVDQHLVDPYKLRKKLNQLCSHSWEDDVLQACTNSVLVFLSRIKCNDFKEANFFTYRNSTGTLSSSLQGKEVNVIFSFFLFFPFCLFFFFFSPPPPLLHFVMELLQ